MVLNTVSGIATHIASKFVLPAGISGTLTDTVLLQLQEVENFTGDDINPNSIGTKYQSAITNLSKADALEEAFSWASTVGTDEGVKTMTSGAGFADKLQLDEFSITAEGNSQSRVLQALNSLSRNAPAQFREAGMKSLENLGRNVKFLRSIS